MLNKLIIFLLANHICLFKSAFANSEYSENRYLNDIEIVNYGTKGKPPVGFIHKYKRIVHKNDDPEQDILNQIINENSVQDEVIKIQNEFVRLESRRFNDIPHWNEDDVKDGLASFLQSCSVIVKKSSQYKISGKLGYFGTAEDWKKVCEKALTYKVGIKQHEFFEQNFIPFVVYDKKKKKSTSNFTAYNEPAFAASRVKTGKYQYPIMRQPYDCKKQQCPTRSEINKSPSKFKEYYIAWLSNPIDVWNIQLQGSGILLFPGRSFQRVRYDGFNNRKSTNFWKTFSASKIMPKEYASSLRTINQWFDENPKTALKIVNRDDSYVFLNFSKNNFPVGASTARLTPSRSVAVDNSYIPYGMPLWIKTKIPVLNHSNTSKYLEINRLMVAQDTGSAITGANRADIFMGHGRKAENIAKNFKYAGRSMVLIPKIVIDKYYKK